jgi:hypothetical protein
MKVVSRAYNQFTFDRVNSTVTKSSTTQRLLDELNYYKTVAEYYPEQQILFPRLLSSNSTGPTYSFTSEFYDYPDLGKYLIGDHHIGGWMTPFIAINKILQQWDTIKITNNMASYNAPEIEQNARAMYIDKTETEYQALVKMFADKYPDFNPKMFTNYGYEINGMLCDNFEFIWPRVKSYIEANLITYTPVMIHGDCCLSNLLYGGHYGVVRFVDPRGSFGVKGVYGDRRYDIAKLYHSVDGKYEFIINDKYELSCTATQYRLSYSRTDNPGKAEFEELILSNYNKKEILIIAGTIYIGMAARHYDNVSRQEMMYFTGLRLLNEGMNL